ncbi:MAG: hypothetical protein AAGE59_33215 [Cyanobacteria bacterium P01_F01_bin.86]
MSDSFPLAPRYRLDDEDAWLVGIDPLRRYWFAANGDETIQVVVPGLSTHSFEGFREAILAFRAMRSGSSIELPTALGTTLEVKCVSRNCFLLEAEVNGFTASHLFDQEALESLLMTAHPDWCCAPHHEDLGRRMLSLSWNKSANAEVA